MGSIAMVWSHPLKPLRLQGGGVLRHIKARRINCPLLIMPSMSSCLVSVSIYATERICSVSLVRRVGC